MGSWQNVYQSVSAQPLESVYAVSRNEVWFSGLQLTLIQYFNGDFIDSYSSGTQVWTALEVGAGLSGVDAGLVMAGDWAGQGVVLSGIAVGQRWDAGTLGTRVTTAEPIATVWAAGPQLYVAGNFGGVYRGPPWMTAQVTTPGGSSGENVTGGYGVGPDEVWVSTSGASGAGALYHYVGGALDASVPSPAAAGGFNGLWGISARELWGVGPNGTIVHVVPDGGLERPDAGRGTHWFSVWASAPDDVWVVGNETLGTTHGVVARWNGSSFRRELVAPVYLTAIHGTGPLDVWAVDHAAGIWHYGP
jgi:hypothetical protein